MQSASSLLFGTLPSGKQLFKNQLDLVNHLLHTPGSAYFIRTDISKEDENRAQGRLKTYLSQLLSDNIFRNLTEDFKASLALVIANKLPPDIKDDIVNAIISNLQQKNSALSRKEEGSQHLGSRISLKEDIKEAGHIIVISARPIDLNLPLKESEFNIRNWFYEDLVRAMLGAVDRMKYYRFNFPTETYCDLFWQGLEKLMIKYLFNLADRPEYIRFLYTENFTVTTETFHEYETFIQSRPFMPDDQVSQKRYEIMYRIATEVIERLNRNKFISVFYNSHPIFSVPIIAINPNDSGCKIYGILDSEEDKNVVYKFSQENTILWRLFFWDKIKASDMGQATFYKKTSRHVFPDVRS